VRVDGTVGRRGGSAGIGIVIGKATVVLGQRGEGWTRGVESGDAAAAFAAAVPQEAGRRRLLRASRPGGAMHIHPEL
jgi:hypothetical protein